LRLFNFTECNLDNFCLAAFDYAYLSAFSLRAFQKCEGTAIDKKASSYNYDEAFLPIIETELYLT
jgi:hypothetical protein